jgi:hypothetical protein
MQPELFELRSFLVEEFKKRKGFKAQYSKRAFSRDLGLSTTSLNGFLSGKRDLSLSNIEKIFRYLKKRAPINCSWCGLAKKKTNVMIGGPKAQYICQSCVETCNEILRTNRKQPRL